MNNKLNIGLFYQSGYRIEACFFALQQFRKYYPDAPVAFYEDNTDILKPVADKFNCIYNKTDKQGYNDPNSGRPAFNIETTVAWLNRVYEACTTTLKDVEWVIHMEDDVWFTGCLDTPPPFDLSGIPGMGWAGEKLYDYLGVKKRGAYGCGGSVFNREKFIIGYNKIQNLDWEYIENLAERGSPTQWTDSMLTFIFYYMGGSVGNWSGVLEQYRNPDVPHLGNREGWPGSIEDLESKQNNAKIIHCWKPYYYPTKEESAYVTNALINN